jgi:hypothetical protein
MGVVGAFGVAGTPRPLQRATYPDLVEVGQQIGRVLVDPKRAGVEQLLASVAPGEHAHS